MRLHFRAAGCCAAAIESRLPLGWMSGLAVHVGGSSGTAALFTRAATSDAGGTSDGPGLAGVNGRERDGMDEAEVLDRDGRRS